MEVWSCFSRIRQYNFFKISWLDCEQYGTNQCKKRNTINIVQCSKCWLPYDLNVTDPLMIPFNIFFYLVMKRLMITKNPLVKIKNFAVNHKSSPVKLNPALWILITNMVYTIDHVWHLFRILKPISHCHWTVVCGLIGWGKQWSQQLFVFQQKKRLYV